MSAIARHLQRYLHTHRISAGQLEKRARIGKGVLHRIIRGDNVMSPKMLAKLDPLLRWPVECQIECKETRAWQQTQAREGERVKPFSRMERVAKLKASKPIYACRAWG